jgi:cytochrome c oxidase subunit IV
MGHAPQTSQPNHDAAHHEQHGSYGTYISVFIALLVLTAISFVVGNSATLREKTPGVMWSAMMAVSCAKAMLVILFFMHLKWEANWKYVLTIPASIMSVFLVLMLIPDVGQRTRDYAEERWLYAVSPNVEHHGEDHDHSHESKSGHSHDGESKPKHD